MSCQTPASTKAGTETEALQPIAVPSITQRAPDLAPVSVETESVYFAGGTVMTATGERFDPGYVLVENGLITYVGAEPIDVSPETRVVDVRDRFVTPGIIDTHSHLGVHAVPSVSAHRDVNESTGPSAGDVDAIHSVWPQDPGFWRALKGGVTVLQILPGSANLVGGRTVTLQMHRGVSSRAMLFEEAPMGVKMACGENPKRVYGRRDMRPSTRMGNMAVFRKIFRKAQELDRAWTWYQEANQLWEAQRRSLPEGVSMPIPAPLAPERDGALETLIEVMRGDVLVHVHCYRADEMIQILELAKEFGFEVRSFHHALEAYKIAETLAQEDVSISTWADWWGFKLEAWDGIVENAAMFSAVGGRAVIHSDSEEDIQRLNQEAAKALYAGRRAGLEISENEALRWITANAAWTLGIDHLTGTLEEGKRGDIVVWSAHPFSVYAYPELVFVEGVREFDITRGDAPWSDFELYGVPGAQEKTPR